MTIEEFIAQHSIQYVVEWADSNPNMDDMPAGSTHYVCTLTTELGGTMAVHYSMGPALQGPPELADVLDCLASDAASVESARSFDDWATDMGYFPMESGEDYRRAERTWDTIQEQSDDLKRLLGDDAYETLLWNVERR